ncbi:hypothetical protein GWI33_021421 [Rhynchophorus ferrugineus]|uniref:Uncharacterized protein n=1 Tax=Rhynchophorus ferrugineus TaxID=354439 RepID=A0A834IRA5_RHYFE|nr:hypothetical protein GWI33_021421 [Rhynchophorus ferrugineus]
MINDDDICHEFVRFDVIESARAISSATSETLCGSRQQDSSLACFSCVPALYPSAQGRRSVAPPASPAAAAQAAVAAAKLRRSRFERTHPTTPFRSAVLPSSRRTDAQRHDRRPVLASPRRRRHHHHLVRTSGYRRRGNNRRPRRVLAPVADQPSTSSYQD